MLLSTQDETPETQNEHTKDDIWSTSVTNGQQLNYKQIFNKFDKMSYKVGRSDGNIASIKKDPYYKHDKGSKYPIKVTGSTSVCNIVISIPECNWIQKSGKKKCDKNTQVPQIPRAASDAEMLQMDYEGKKCSDCHATVCNVGSSRRC